MTISFLVEDFQPIVTAPLTPILGKRTRNGEAYTPAEGMGWVTTREVRKLVDHLMEFITHQTILIKSTKVELLEAKHGHNVLKLQNDELREEVRAPRT